jgi:serine/threonine-protein kinase
MPLDHIGRYKIVAELGKGAMGVVYKATDPNIGRTVALKTMRVDVVHGMEAEEIVRRFHAEARNAGVLNHTNIVTIYDAQELEGVFYIAMEFIEGQTLLELLKHGNLSPEKILDITRQVCAGLDYASARGIVHRDIKPANIMIEADGTVKIMDFGIAKSIGTGMTSTGQVLGTPNYMSPEQVKGRTLDGRSDLFSMGVVLYEMLTGERPFTGDNVTTIIYKIVNEQPPAPRDLDATVHPGLSAVVMKALAKNRDERYQKGTDLVNDLLHYNEIGAGAQQTAVMADHAIPEVVQPPIRPASEAAPAASAGAAAAAQPAPSPSPPTSVRVQKTATEPPSMKKPIVVVGPLKKGPLMVGVSLLVALVAMAGYMGIKLMSKPAAQAGAVPTETIEQPNQPETSATEAAPLAAASGKAKGASRTATPRAPAPVPTGDLHITTTPAGATISVDGKDQPQQTPAVLKLTQGQHEVIVSLDGYKSESRHPEITIGQRTNMTAVLTATAGFLVITSNPPGADIVVDGKPTGSVTPSKIKVSQGQHAFAVRRDGSKEQAMSVFVLAGQTLPLDFTLPGRVASSPTRKSSELQNVPPSNVSTSNAPASNKASATVSQAQQAEPKKQGGGNPFRKLGRLFGSKEDSGTLEIRTNPAGAEILVGGNPTGKKTPVKTSSPVGSYTITLQMNGYKPVTRKIQITKGQTTGVEETLEKQ